MSVLKFHKISKLAFGSTFGLLGLLVAAPIAAALDSNVDSPTHWISGMWTGEDTNDPTWPAATISIELATNGYGVAYFAGIDMGIPSTFTYTIAKERIIYQTNGTPPLTGSLRYDEGTDRLVYRALGASPIFLHRDTNVLVYAMLGSMAGTTNFHDMISKLGRYFNTPENFPVTNEDANYRAWLLDAFKQQAASYRHVVLVRINESHFQLLPLPHKHRLDCKGTVVRNYKGDWKVGEQLTWYRELEAASTNRSPNVGQLEYLLLDEHTNGPIGIGAGQNWDYTQEFDRSLQSTNSIDGLR